MKKSWIVFAAAIPLAVFASIAVWKLAGDDSRRQGALGSAEAVNLSWRGDWTAEAEYTAGNVVSHEGASYVAEGEKLSAPVADCTECGWKAMAAGPSPDDAAAPAAGYEVVTEVLATPTSPLGFGKGASTVVSCPAGKKVLAGGFTGQPGPFQIESNAPVLPSENGGLYGWKYKAINPRQDLSANNLTIYAICGDE